MKKLAAFSAIRQFGCEVGFNGLDWTRLLVMVFWAGVLQTPAQELSLLGPQDEFHFVQRGERVVVLRYVGTGGVVRVPAEVEGLPVTDISAEAFRSSAVTQVELPESIARIGPSAFERCEQMLSIDLPPGISRIADNTFRDCLSLTEVKLPFGVTRIGDHAFDGCRELASVTLPDSVHTIIDHAFAGCVSLATVQLSSQLTTISRWAFSDCQSLTELTLPAKVRQIESHAFYGCLELQRLDVPAENPNYSSIDGVLFNPDRTTLLQYPQGRSGPYRIPPTVVQIRERAFEGAKWMTELVVPEGVTEIEESAFAECRGLEHVEIPDTVTVLSERVFSNCISLQSVRLPSKLSIIPDWLFVECRALESVDIPDTVRSIGYSAFRECSALGRVHIPDSVLRIGGCAFEGCRSLDFVRLSPRLARIDQRAFRGCSRLSEVLIPESVGLIEEEAFASCWALRVVNLPLELRRISDEIFRNCRELERVEIPASVDWIGEGAFEGCSSLSRIRIPATVEHIGERAWGENWALTEIIVAPESKHFCDLDGVLFSSDKTILLQYPPSRPAIEYRVPASVSEISDRAFAGCRNLESISVAPENPGFTQRGGVLYKNTIETEGGVDSSLLSELVQYPVGRTDPYFSIPQGTTTIGASAFARCSHLLEATVASSVSSIAHDAFLDCDRLRSVFFEGDAPISNFVPFNSTPATLYYLPGKEGWDRPLPKRVFWQRPEPPPAGPTLAWLPRITNIKPCVEVDSRCGAVLEIFWASGETVVVESTDSLVTPDWTAIGMQVMEEGRRSFHDAKSNEQRFYRARPIGSLEQ